MVAYYADNPNVTVIIDRREGPDRRDGQADGSFKERRETRDRRRATRARDVPGHRRARRLHRVLAAGETGFGLRWAHGRRDLRIAESLRPAR